MNLNEKKELVIRAFTILHDIDKAFIKVGVSKTDQKALLKNKTFCRRIEIEAINYYESLVTGLDELKDSAFNEGVKLRAIEKLGELFNKDIFSSKLDQNNRQIVPDKIILDGVEA